MRPSFGKSSAPMNPFSELERPKTRKKRRWSPFGGMLRLVLLMAIGCAAGLAGLAAQGYIYFTHDLPSVETLKNYSPPIVTTFYDDKGEQIAEFALQKRYIVPIESIPKNLQNAFVAAEDKNFWEHPGYDLQAIVRAAGQNLQSLLNGGKLIGASTITQQVAKTFFLTPEKTFSRKIREFLLAIRIEKALNKKQILHLYLNQIYLGSSAYGVEAASRIYFGKHVQDLTLAECALLAGLPKAPSEYSPRRNQAKALKRRAYVLDKMLANGIITEEQRKDAFAEKPHILTGPMEKKTEIASDFIEHVRRYVENKYGRDGLYKEGLKVYTTVDLETTKMARSAMEQGLSQLDKREGYRGPIKTLNVKGVVEFLEEKSREREEPLRFGQVTEGVVTQIDNQHIYVRMGSYLKNGHKRDYVGQIKIDPSPDWWVRHPFTRPEKRTRNFTPGDLPFQVGDLIAVRIVDPNIRRKELYRKKYGRQDPGMKNYKKYTEDMLPYFILEPEQTPLAQAALMFRENRTGYVRVMLGGHTSESEYNRATQSRRQAGSSFKPVIYAAALNKGFTCSDIILDSPLVLPIPGTGEVWRPKNYRGGYKGPVTFRNALVKSRNIPTIKILQQIGLEQAKLYARKLGYTSPLVDNLTLALGSTGVSLEEQLTAYSVFPNRGYLVPNVYVTKVVDRHGRVLEQHDPPVLLDDTNEQEAPRVRQVAGTMPARPTLGQDDPSESPTFLARRRIDEGTAYIMTNLLQDVVKEGTATILKKIVGRPDLGGKTGTTNDNVDAWFMGFSPDYTCGVWVGFDDEVSLGQGETGGKAAAPIWGYFMRDVLNGKPVKEFQAPASVELRRVDPHTGLVTSSAAGVEEVFKVGSGPARERSTLIKGAKWDHTGSDLDQF